MTRLEKLAQDIKNKVYRLDDVTIDEYLDYCPYFLDCGDDDYDNRTAIFDGIDIEAIGCRGITCKQCWNKEMIIK
jgi:hypothetical protein